MMGLIKLTQSDKMILEAMKPVVDGIAAVSGSHTEVALHSLDKTNPCIIKVVNGHITGRAEGAPVTGFCHEQTGRGGRCNTGLLYSGGW